MADQVEKVDDSTIKITKTEVVENTITIEELLGQRERLVSKLKNILIKANQEIGAVQSQIKDLDSKIIQAKDLGVASASNAVIEPILDSTIEI